MTPKYDVIIVGTSFAASFFLMRYLRRAPAQTRVLVLERGGTDTKAWQLQNKRTSSIAPAEVYYNATPEKQWYTSPGFGGNSKCWLGGTVRMMPGDFQLKSRYGVGWDWPMTYDDLEQHYLHGRGGHAGVGTPRQPDAALAPLPAAAAPACRIRRCS